MLIVTLHGTSASLVNGYVILQEWTIKCEPDTLGALSSGLAKLGFEPESSEIVFEATDKVQVASAEEQVRTCIDENC
jgi:hypothetical protein